MSVRRRRHASFSFRSIANRLSRHRLRTPRAQRRYLTQLQSRALRVLAECCKVHEPRRLLMSCYGVVPGYTHSMLASNLDASSNKAYFKSRRRVEIERARFRELYFRLCAGAGVAAVDYVKKRGCVFNVFELYCCVKWHGGYDKLCSDRLWHRVGYSLCRVSKRRRTAAQAAQECYVDSLAPVEEGLATLKMKPFASVLEGDDGETALTTDGAQPGSLCLERDLVDGPGKRAKLRTRSRPTQQCQVRRFKKQTSFDLLSTVPLSSPVTGQSTVVCAVAPPQRRVAAQSKAEPPLELQDAFAGDVWRSAVYWLSEFAQAPLQIESPLESCYRLRYASRLLRMRQKLNHDYQRQSTRGILNQEASEMSETKTTQESEASDEEGEAKRNVVMEGPQYQAEIPQWRPLTQESIVSKWNTQPLNIDSLRTERPLLLTSCKRELRLLSQESRIQWMNECSRQLWRNVGPFAEDLALSRMGQVVQTGWSSSDQERFEAGIAKYGRDFASIQLEYLPERSLDQLVMYYYSIWKQRRTRGAALHYHQKQQRRHAAEREAANQQQEAEDNRRRLTEESKKRRLDRSQQRKLREVLSWIRSLAKHPDQTQLMHTGPLYSLGLRMAHFYRSGTVQRQ